jgi:membrane-bound lytic murein transglycosylase D
MKYRVGLSSLLRWNGLTKRSIIRPGQRLVIYRNGHGPSASSSSGKVQTTTSGGYTYYTVKKGDTLGAIAKKYGRTVKQLMAWNGLKNANSLRIGQRIRVSPQ